ncbi:hypothetical protein [Dactylosporangium sp. NPDC048998]
MNGHRELRLDAPGARRRAVLSAGARSWLLGSLSESSGRWRG